MKDFFINWFTKRNFKRKLSHVAYTLAQVFTNRMSYIAESFLLHTINCHL